MTQGTVLCVSWHVIAIVRLALAFATLAICRDF